MKIPLPTNCFYIIALALSLVLPTQLVAQQSSDSWVVPQDTAVGRKVSNDDEIYKWCADNGEHVRYASGSIELSGYHRCGTLATAKSCDPLGNRHFGPATTKPYSYADCSLGQRIYIERDGVPLSIKESQRSERENRRAARKAKDVQAESQKTERIAKEHNEYLNGLDALLAPTEGRQNSRHKKSTSPSQANLESLRALGQSIDPEQVKEILKLLPQIMGQD